ncbi:hypothetical protein MMC10_006380 [Thelotrema lepadinum]|nr:hypothetical protein [Thelotrema lepadinum]
MSPLNSSPETKPPKSTFDIRIASFFVLLISLAAYFLFPQSPSPSTKMSGSSGATPPVSADAFIQGFKFRRSVYTINNTSPVPDSRIEEILQQVVVDAPSAYNSQTGRFVLLLGEKSKTFWEKVTETIKPGILEAKGEDVWKFFDKRLGIFRGAYGSILFFEDDAAIKEAQEKHKDSAHLFPEWSDHSTGMAQVILWSALELEGFGASLQHFNGFKPVQDMAIKEYGMPGTAALKAQLVFGAKTAPHPDRKPKLPINETVKIFK